MRHPILRRFSSLVVAILMVALSMGAALPGALAGSTTTFSDGAASKEYDMSFGRDTSTSVVVPGRSTVLYATANMSTVDGQPVLDPTMDFGDDGSIEWAFSGKGYGMMGHQTVFEDGAPASNASLPNGGTATGFDLLLPRDAEVLSASADVKMKSRDTYVKWDFEGLGIDLNPMYYSFPAFGDLDDDGDLDAVVGSTDGLLYYFENDGTSSGYNWTAPAVMKNQIGNDLDTSYSSRPALVDIDNDNDLDLIIGSGDGSFMYAKNTGTVTDPTWMGDNSLLGSADIGYYASPSFADIDNDGDQDLFCGEYYGRVALAYNTGTAAAPVFDHNAANWAWVAVPGGAFDVGYYSMPELFDLQGSGTLDLFVGGLTGYILFYNNTGTASVPSFDTAAYLADHGDPMYTEGMSAPRLADLDGDGDSDLAVGSYYGNVHYWENEGSSTAHYFVRNGLFGRLDCGTEGVPSLGDMDNDGDLDLVVGNEGGDLVFYENVGNSTDPAFQHQKTIADVTPGWSAPQLVDYDTDGDLDIVVGNTSGVITYLKNIGSPVQMNLMRDTSIFGNGYWGTQVRVYLADLDGDGDLDLTTGNNYYTLNYYENTGSILNPDWDYDSDMYNGINTGSSRVSPILADFDGDGDHDLTIGNTNGDLVYYENTGGPYDPIWSTRGTPFYAVDSFYRSAGTMGDLNGDGNVDLVMSNNYGKLHYFAKHVLSEEYDITLGLFGKATPVWTKTGDDPVLDETIDIKDTIANELASSSVETDVFGNRMSTIMFTLKVDPVGCDISMQGLSVVYRYKARTVDFSDSLNTYMSYHRSDIDAQGNLEIPIAVDSASEGIINMSGLRIEFDAPPTLVTPIPDLEIGEETYNDTLLDLRAYFEDDETSDDMLSFAIESNTLNSSMVEVKVHNGQYLSVDAFNPPASPNWTGFGFLIVSAEDTQGNKVLSNEFKVSIVDVNDPPWFTSTPVLTVLADTPYEYQATAEDIDEDDVLVFDLEIAPEGMSINIYTGRMTWQPTNAQVGTQGIRVTVFDGTDTVDQTFSVTVEGNPQTNHPPVFLTDPPTVAHVGGSYEYDADARDPDPGTSLKFTLEKGPSQMSMEEDTGILSWPDLIRPYVGPHEISIKVTDGVASAHQNFTLVIALDPKDNNAPTFTTEPVDFAYPNEAYSYKVGVDDKDSMDKGNLKVYLDAGPKGMALDTSLNLGWTPTTADMGGHLVVLRVVDLSGAVERQSFTLNVIQIEGQYVVIILSPDDDEKVQSTFKVVGTLDASVMNAIRTVQVKIDGKGWKDASGTTTWSHSYDRLSPGRHEIEARAYDGRNYSAASKIVVYVKEDQGTSAGGEGMEAVLVALIILMVVLMIVAYIIGSKRGRKRAVEDYEIEEKRRPKPLSREAEEVRAKEETFRQQVYDGREMSPEMAEPDEGAFRGQAPTDTMDEGYEEQAEAYEEIPATEPEPEPEPGPEPFQPEPEVEVWTPAAAEEAVEPEVEPEPEPAPEPTEVEPGPPKKEKETEMNKEGKDALDDILRKLSS